MAVLSKWLRLSTTCEEYVHPWTSSCFDASYNLMFDVIRESLRIYITAYLLALVMRGRIPSRKDLIRTTFGILQSTVFLTTHGIGYSIVLCTLRRIMGNFNFLTVSFLPSFLSSIVAILIERPSRRGLLSLYVTNVASETLFRMAVWRKWVKSVPYGEVAIFSVSVSCLLYFFRGNHSTNDPIYGLLRFVVGGDEEKCEDSSSKNSDGNVRPGAVLPPPPELEASDDKCTLFDRLMTSVRRFIYNLRMRPPLDWCPHPNGCIYYALQGGSKMFAVGYGLQLCLKLLLQAKRILRDPTKLKGLPFELDTMMLAAFLSCFSILFRGTSCSLRRLYGRDCQEIALPAGFIAGLSFIFYRGNTIALHFMWKTFQVLYNKGVESGRLWRVAWASVFFHAFSTAVLFHCAILEPHNLRPSYWKFLTAVSGGRIAKMDRKCIDHFGLETSKSLSAVLSQQRRH